MSQSFSLVVNQVPSVTSATTTTANVGQADDVQRHEGGLPDPA